MSASLWRWRSRLELVIESYMLLGAFFEGWKTSTSATILWPILLVGAIPTNMTSITQMWLVLLLLFLIRYPTSGSHAVRADWIIDLLGLIDKYLELPLLHELLDFVPQDVVFVHFMSLSLMVPTIFVGLDHIGYELVSWDSISNNDCILPRRKRQ